MRKGTGHENLGSLLLRFLTVDKARCTAVVEYADSLPGYSGNGIDDCSAAAAGRGDVGLANPLLESEAHESAWVRGEPGSTGARFGGSDSGKFGIHLAGDEHPQFLSEGEEFWSGIMSGRDSSPTSTTVSNRTPEKSGYSDGARLR